MPTNRHQDILYFARVCVCFRLSWRCFLGSGLSGPNGLSRLAYDPRLLLLSAAHQQATLMNWSSSSILACCGTSCCTPSSGWSARPVHCCACTVCWLTPPICASGAQNSSTSTRGTTLGTTKLRSCCCWNESLCAGAAAFGLGAFRFRRDEANHCESEPGPATQRLSALGRRWTRTQEEEAASANQLEGIIGLRMARLLILTWVPWDTADVHRVGVELSASVQTAPVAWILALQSSERN